MLCDGETVTVLLAVRVADDVTPTLRLPFDVDADGDGENVARLTALLDDVDQVFDDDADHEREVANVLTE
jgi:hypothetical protein